MESQIDIQRLEARIKNIEYKLDEVLALLKNKLAENFDPPAELTIKNSLRNEVIGTTGDLDDLFLASIGFDHYRSENTNLEDPYTILTPSFTLEEFKQEVYNLERSTYGKVVSRTT